MCYDTYTYVMNASFKYCMYLRQCHFLYICMYVCAVLNKIAFASSAEYGLLLQIKYKLGCIPTAMIGMHPNLYLICKSRPYSALFAAAGVYIHILYICTHTHTHILLIYIFNIYIYNTHAIYIYIYIHIYTYRFWWSCRTRPSVFCVK